MEYHLYPHLGTTLLYSLNLKMLPANKVLCQHGNIDLAFINELVDRGTSLFPNIGAIRSSNLFAVHQNDASWIRGKSEVSHFEKKGTIVD